MRIVDPDDGAQGKLLYGLLQQLLGVVQKQAVYLIVNYLGIGVVVLVVLRSTFITICSIIGFIGLLEDRFLDLLEGALLVSAGHLMVVYVALNQDGALPLRILGLNQRDDLDELVEGFFALLDLVEGHQQDLETAVALVQNQGHNYGDPQKVDDEDHVEHQVVQDCTYYQHNICPCKYSI